MYRKSLLLFAGMLVGHTACTGIDLDDASFEDDGHQQAEAGDTDAAAMLPVHTASFEVAPTQDQIDQTFAAFARSKDGEAVRGLLEPTGIAWPKVGWKRVTVIAHTGTVTNAGNDERLVSVRTRWLADTGATYVERFALDKPSFDDLEEGSYDVFYYLMPVQLYAAFASADTFTDARLQNSSDDGWYCVSVEIQETNHDGDNRTQFLTFNEWVDSPQKPVTDYKPATNTSSLSYF